MVGELIYFLMSFLTVFKTCPCITLIFKKNENVTFSVLNDYATR
jgi:sulfur relay (sulfurtransferase) DsrC/TusE family protein